MQNIEVKHVCIKVGETELKLTLEECTALQRALQEVAGTHTVRATTPVYSPIFIERDQTPQHPWQSPFTCGPIGVSCELYNAETFIRN